MYGLTEANDVEWGAVLIEARCQAFRYRGLADGFAASANGDTQLRSSPLPPRPRGRTQSFETSGAFPPPSRSSWGDVATWVANRPIDRRSRAKLLSVCFAPPMQDHTCGRAHFCRAFVCPIASVRSIPSCSVPVLVCDVVSVRQLCSDHGSSDRHAGWRHWVRADRRQCAVEAECPR